MAETKAKNYTDEMVETMHELYTAEPTRETVEQLAEDFGKSVRSINILRKLIRASVNIVIVLSSNKRKSKFHCFIKLICS